MALFDSATGFANAHPGTDYASCPVTKCVINTGEGTCTGGMGPYGSYITMAASTPYGVVLAQTDNAGYSLTTFCYACSTYQQDTVLVYKIR